MKPLISILIALILATGCSRDEPDTAVTLQPDESTTVQSVEPAPTIDAVGPKPARELRQAEDIYRETIQMLESKGF